MVTQSRPAGECTGHTNPGLIPALASTPLELAADVLRDDCDDTLTTRDVHDSPAAPLPSPPPRRFPSAYPLAHRQPTRLGRLASVCDPRIPVILT